MPDVEPVHVPLTESNIKQALRLLRTEAPNLFHRRAVQRVLEARTDRAAWRRVVKVTSKAFQDIRPK